MKWAGEGLGSMPSAQAEHPDFWLATRDVQTGENLLTIIFLTASCFLHLLAAGVFS